MAMLARVKNVLYWQDVGVLHIVILVHTWQYFHKWYVFVKVLYCQDVGVPYIVIFVRLHTWQCFHTCTWKVFVNVLDS